MNKLIEKTKRNCALFIFSMSYFIMHIYIYLYPIGGDDTWFLNTIKRLSLIKYLKMRYFTWTSRLVIESALTFFVRHIILWIVVDTIIWVAIPFMICKILDFKGEKTWIVYSMVALYPIKGMASAGWIATTVNYIWPLACLLLIVLVLKQSIDRGHAKWYEYLVLVLCGIYGCNQEQVALLTFGLLICLLLYQFIYKHNFKIPLIYVGIIIALFSLCFILTCPGNTARSIKETSTWYPEFVKFSFIKKIELGIYSIAYRFIGLTNRIYFVFAAFLTVLVYIKTKNIIRTMISSVPLLCLLICSMKEIPYETMQKIDLSGKITLVSYLFLSILSIVISICWLFSKDKVLLATILIILVAGFMSSFVMGFSPTVWASKERTIIFMEFSLILVTLICYKKHEDILKCHVIPIYITAGASVISNILFAAGRR